MLLPISGAFRRDSEGERRFWGKALISFLAFLVRRDELCPTAPLSPIKAVEDDLSQKVLNALDFGSVFGSVAKTSYANLFSCFPFG